MAIALNIYLTVVTDYFTSYRISNLWLLRKVQYSSKTTHLNLKLNKTVQQISQFGAAKIYMSSTKPSKKEIFHIHSAQL